MKVREKVRLCVYICVRVCVIKTSDSFFLFFFLHTDYPSIPAGQSWIWPPDNQREEISLGLNPNWHPWWFFFFFPNWNCCKALLLTWIYTTKHKRRKLVITHWLLMIHDPIFNSCPTPCWYCNKFGWWC